MSKIGLIFVDLVAILWAIVVDLATDLVAIATLILGVQTESRETLGAAASQTTATLAQER